MEYINNVCGYWARRHTDTEAFKHELAHTPRLSPSYRELTHMQCAHAAQPAPFCFADKSEGQSWKGNQATDISGREMYGCQKHVLIPWFPLPLPVSAACQDLPPGKTNHKAKWWMWHSRIRRFCHLDGRHCISASCAANEIYIWTASPGLA